MKVVKLLVEYEKLFPYEYFDLGKYKKTIEDGLLEKPTNKYFEDELKLREHLLRFFYLMQVIDNIEEAKKVKNMKIEDIENEIEKFRVLIS